MTAVDNWLKLGVIGRSHGIKGAFFVSGRDQAWPKSVSSIVIGPDPVHGRSVKVVASRLQGERVVLQCEGIDSPESAKALVGQALWGKRHQVAVAEDREYLWTDLYGKSVIDAEGVLIGTIVSVNNYGASDVVEVRDAQGRMMGLPFISQYVDMGFASRDAVIRLVVPASVFDEAWEEPAP